MISSDGIRYHPKKARGKAAKLDRVGRAVCFYIAARGGSIGSVLGTLGMPHVSGDGDGHVNLLAELGRCLDAVSTHERKKRTAPAATPRLVQRYQAYMDMVAARNQLSYAEYMADLRLHQFDYGLAGRDDMETAQEEAIQTRDRYLQAKQDNDRLRKGKLYTEEVGVMLEQLRLRKISV